MAEHKARFVGSRTFQYPVVVRVLDRGIGFHLIIHGVEQVQHIGGFLHQQITLILFQFINAIKIASGSIL